MKTRNFFAVAATTALLGWLWQTAAITQGGRCVTKWEHGIENPTPGKSVVVTVPGGTPMNWTGRTMQQDNTDSGKTLTFYWVTTSSSFPATEYNNQRNITTPPKSTDKLKSLPMGGLIRVA